MSHLDGLFKFHLLCYLSSAIHPKLPLDLSPGQTVAAQLLKTISWSFAYTYSQPGQPLASPCHIQPSKEIAAVVRVTQLFTSEMSCLPRAMYRLNSIMPTVPLIYISTAASLFQIRVTARLHSKMAPSWLRWGLQIQPHCAQGPILPVAAAQQYRLVFHHQGHAERGFTETVWETNSAWKSHTGLLSPCHLCLMYPQMVDDSCAAAVNEGMACEVCTWTASMLMPGSCDRARNAPDEVPMAPYRLLSVLGSSSSDCRPPETPGR